MGIDRPYSERWWWKAILLVSQFIRCEKDIPHISLQSSLLIHRERWRDFQMNHSTLWSLRSSPLNFGEGANCATKQSSTDLAGQLGLENMLSNLGKGRLLWPAKNTCPHWQNPYFTQRVIHKGVSNYLVKLEQLCYNSCVILNKSVIICVSALLSRFVIFNIGWFEPIRVSSITMITSSNPCPCLRSVWDIRSYSFLLRNQSFRRIRFASMVETSDFCRQIICTPNWMHLFSRALLARSRDRFLEWY